MTFSASRPLRVGIISANWGARAHLPAWRAVPGVEVVAICTSRRETAEVAARDHAIPRAFWDYRDMASQPDIDLIDCGTRPDLRADMVLSALVAGKHVYNAIPFAKDLATARALAKAQRDSGCVGAVDAFAFFAPAHREMRRLLARGAIGKPHHLRIAFKLPLFAPARTGFAFNWFHEADRGVSALRNFGSHALHTALQLLDEPILDVVGHDTTQMAQWQFTDGSTLEAKTHDTASLVLRSASGVIIEISVSWAAWASDGWTSDLQGSNGRLLAHHAGFPRGNMTLRGAIDGGMQMADLPISADFLAPAGLSISAANEDAEHSGIPSTVPVFTIAAGLKDFVDAIVANRAPRNSFAQALYVEEILDAASRSVQSRRWEPIAPPL